MELKKPRLHILTIWRLRLLFLSVLPAFLSALLAGRVPLAAWCFTGLWGCAFLYFYIFYYPIKYNKLAYTANHRCLLVHCGVISTRVKGVPFGSIQYIGLRSSPLERAFGVCSLTVYCAGSKVSLYGLSLREALRLRRMLMSKSKEAQNERI